MLFREFLLQNDFQVPLTGKGGDLGVMRVRGLPQHNLKFRFRFAKRVVSSPPRLNFLDKQWHQELLRKVEEIHTPKLIGGASEGGVTELSGN